MKRGDQVDYRCLAGLVYRAEVRVVRTDGRVDLAVDVGSNDPHELTRIESVPAGQHRPGTCSAREE